MTLPSLSLAEIRGVTLTGITLPANVLPIHVTLNGNNIEFTYTRSKAAMSDGVTVTVEWSDTLTPSSWSNAGVSETILSEDSALQHVKATLPIGTSGRRFVHLRVTRP